MALNALATPWLIRNEKPCQEALQMIEKSRRVESPDDPGDHRQPGAGVFGGCTTAWAILDLPKSTCARPYAAYPDGEVARPSGPKCLWVQGKGNAEAAESGPDALKADPENEACIPAPVNVWKNN